MTNTAIAIETLKAEYPTLADFNKSSSVTAKSWAQAQKLAQREQEQAASMALATCSEEDKQDKASVFVEPESLKHDLGDNYSKIMQLRAEGTASKEGFNSMIQDGLSELAESGNKKFQLLKAVLWVMATAPEWVAEYKQVTGYIKAVSPFRVASKVKKQQLPDGRTEKTLIIQLIKVKGASWRKRPAKFWNRVADKNENETKLITKDQLDSQLAKMAERVTEAKIEPSDRLVAAATFLDNLGLSDLAAAAREQILNSNQ